MPGTGHMSQQPVCRMGGHIPTDVLQNMGTPVGEVWSRGQAAPLSLPETAKTTESKKKVAGPCQVFLEERLGEGSGQTPADPEVTGEAKAGPGNPTQAIRKWEGDGKGLVSVPGQMRRPIGK